MNDFGTRLAKPVTTGFCFGIFLLVTAGFVLTLIGNEWGPSLLKAVFVINGVVGLPLLAWLAWLIGRNLR